jgi:glycine cleavage system H lipoate-binding protein
MSEPILFISHNKMKEGKLDAFLKYNQDGFQLIQEQKPATVALLAYAGEDSGQVSFVHLFPDAQAMELHFQGAAERSKRAYEYMQPISMEIYGSPNDAVLEMMKQIAESGVSVSIDTDYLGGFLRLKSG